MIKKRFEHYSLRFHFHEEYHIKDKLQDDCEVIVVIPCYNEEYLIKSIKSLTSNNPDALKYEVIVVINHGEHASESIKNNNTKTLQETQEWISKNELSNIHLIQAFDLPKKHAGVGLARKIGMDEAVQRFSQREQDGIILCFDADTLSSPNYISDVISYFNSFPQREACSIHFEHPFQELDDEKQRQAIVNYELHLRYFIEMQRWAGLPHALQTIGSSMAVRTSAYLKEGGMNRRKAGEDFYFLHKFIKKGTCGEINSTSTIPSPRSSDRVPFGTGKAISDQLVSTDDYTTYSYKSFSHLRELVGNADNFFTNPSYKHLSKENIAFLNEIGFPQALEHLLSNTSNAEAFKKRFFQWFDAFTVMKYMHWMRDNHFENITPKEALSNTSSELKIPGHSTLEDILIALRTLQVSRKNQ